MAYYLVTYRPLALTQHGQTSARNNNIPLYVDASCRREPDFQSQFPSISAICRGRNFAPRVSQCDHIIYLTSKGSYPNGPPLPHWRLVAHLQVHTQPFSTHAAAEVWYKQQNMPTPSNCMVQGSNPLPLSQCGPVPTVFNRLPSSVAQLRAWNAAYLRRAQTYPMFISTIPIFIDLINPPIITQQMLIQIFGRVPPTRTPPAILAREAHALFAMVGI